MNIKKKKVLQVVRQYHPLIGGMEGYVEILTRKLELLGYQVDVLTLDKSLISNEKISMSDNVYRIGFWGGRRFFIPKIFNLDLNEYDIVHIHGIDGFFSTIPTKVAPTAKLFCTTHGGFFHTKNFLFLKNVYFKLLIPTLSKKYKCLFACGHNDLEKFNSLPVPVIEIENAVNPIGNSYSNDGGLLYVGRLSSNKGILNLIDSYSAYRSSGGSRHLHIVGPSDDLTICEVNQYIKVKQLKGVIIHGALSAPQLSDLVAKCTFFVSASVYEGFGLSMVESMASGLIPLVNPNDSFKNLIYRARVGVLVDYTIIDSLKIAINSFSPEEIEDSRVVAKEFGATFSWDVLTQKVVACYES